MCKSCNDSSGHDWDNVLVDVLNPFSLLLGISRERGQVPSQDFETTAGEELTMHAGGQFTHARPEFRRKVENGRQIITIRARSAAEARKMTSGLKRKGTIKHACLRESESYPRGMIKMDPSLGDRQSSCSIVKSALALAFDSGVDPRRCADARGYLLSEDAVPIHGFYYDKDPVLDRPLGVPFHCVTVRGDAESNELLAYVEFFGCWRIALCLDRAYAGPDFVNCYAIDPVKGTPLNLQVSLDFASNDIPLAHDRALLEPSGIERALGSILSQAHESSTRRERERVITEAIRFAAFELGLTEGETFGDEHQCREFARLVTERLTPFLLHSMGLPPQDP